MPAWRRPHFVVGLQPSKHEEKMKKFLLTVTLLFLLVFRSLADEGMWLPFLLGQQVYNDLVKKGLKLTKEQLYNINKMLCF